MINSFVVFPQTSTIGLVTLDEMKAKQEVIVQEREKQLAKKQREKEKEIERELEAKLAEKRKQKQQIHALSFKVDDEEEEDGDDDASSIDNLKAKCDEKSEGIYLLPHTE